MAKEEKDWRQKLTPLSSGWDVALVKYLEGLKGIDPNLQYPGKDPDFVFPEEEE